MPVAGQFLTGGVLFAEDRLPKDFDVNLAADTVDWWAHLDMSPHAGRTATVSVARLPAA